MWPQVHTQSWRSFHETGLQMKKWWLDRRAVIFLCFAAVACALIPVCPDKFDWVGISVTSVYVVLGLASWLDHLGRARSGSSR